jgi:hypothetical protein
MWHIEIIVRFIPLMMKANCPKSSKSSDKNTPKLLGWMWWSGFEPRISQLYDLKENDENKFIHS